MAAVAVSCRTVDRSAQVRTEYQTVYQRDSVYIDCTDTFYVVERGDTVTIREKQTVREYYYTVFRDTLRQSDTIRLEKVVQLASSETPKPIKWWRWFFGGALSAIFVIFAVRIIIRIYFRK